MNETRKSISLVAAMSPDRGIGLNGQMPWHLPGELRHFKAVTMGKPLVMGRKTFESIGRALPGRQNIVVSRNTAFQAPGCIVCGSIEQAVTIAAGDEIMVIGGGELYRQALPCASRMILTLVDYTGSADTWFPAWNPADWTVVSQRIVDAEENSPLPYRVIEMVRV